MGRLRNFSVCGRTLSDRSSREAFSKLPMLKTDAWSSGKDPVCIYSGGMALHYLFSADHGSVYGWGRCLEGQLGDHNADKVNVDPKEPVLVCTPRSELLSASCGAYHSLMALKDGTILSLGRNKHGELGSSNTESRQHSFSVQNDNGRVLRFPCVVAGTDFSVGLSGCGSVYTWGRNEEGQLGSEGSSTPQATKISLLPPITQIASGWGHCVAISSNLLILVSQYCTNEIRTRTGDSVGSK